METIDVNSLLTTAGVSTAVLLLTQVILTTTAMDETASNRWGPLIALALGVVLAVAASVILVAPVTAVTIGNAVLTGVVGGLAAIGMHSVATKSQVGAAIAAGLGIPATPPNPPAGQ